MPLKSGFNKGLLFLVVPGGHPVFFGFRGPETASGSLPLPGLGLQNVPSASSCSQSVQRRLLHIQATVILSEEASVQSPRSLIFAVVTSCRNKITFAKSVRKIELRFEASHQFKHRIYHLAIGPHEAKRWLLSSLVIRKLHKANRLIREKRMGRETPPSSAPK